MTQSLFIPGPLPGFNVIIGRASRWAYTSAKKEWSAAIGLYIKKAKLKPMSRVYLSFVWHEKNKRKDPDNIAGIGRKFILDSLVKHGILPDDGWDEIAGWSDAWLVSPKVGVLVTMEEKP